MARMIYTLAGCLLLSVPVLAQPVEELPILTPEEEKLLAPYMTKDFRLTAPLEVRDELTGFGTFFGTIWRIEPEGQWTITRILRKEPILIGKGQLTKKQIYALAQSLAVFDPLTLPNFGRPVVNPHVIIVSFGPRASTMTFGVDQVLAPTSVDALLVNPSPLAPYVVGPAAPTALAVPALNPQTRYAGIQWAVRGLIQPNLGVQMDLPERLRQLGHP